MITMILREQSVCLNAGDWAPDFVLPDENGNAIRLADFKGSKNVLVVLHPGDLTADCRDHFRFYRQHLRDFRALNTQILAINMASVEANRKWTQNVGNLGYPVLSDMNPLGDVTLKYDCFVPGEGYGKKAVFVIDKAGKLRHIEVLKEASDACPNIESILDVLRAM
ncbi:redoxin domain-containing protein [Candidatus Thorarchaeota archaeon]|nr:MAG: redoxin domain-containing protein [Candidatus Thorarchaeota archaeon]